ncbi:hypothetical protein DZC52_07410 [Wenzhouxiangella sediminis]|uniref:Uncharacterized protein n=1 Tax=Wenzhouxiangella sediminis TaxID=1792836 RepID=A0A3E1K8W0_9GAMM|nr:hypothetical protein DZC52_07410 [Wenzhouxiangella sediminis]
MPPIKKIRTSAPRTSLSIAAGAQEPECMCEYMRIPRTAGRRQLRFRCATSPISEELVKSVARALVSVAAGAQEPECMCEYMRIPSTRLTALRCGSFPSENRHSSIAYAAGRRLRQLRLPSQRDRSRVWREPRVRWPPDRSDRSVWINT